MSQSFMWPLYFATKALNAQRLALKKGQPFPIQDKFYIRGLGRAFGVTDADTRPFGDLPYVGVLNVQTEDCARHIMDRGMLYEDAQKLVATKVGG